MKNQNTISRRSEVGGFSLIELMVSMTIGLIVVISAMAAYLGSSSASRVSEAQARMNEDAQAALTTLSQQIKLAGANPVQASRTVEFRRNPVFNATYVGDTSTPYTTTSYTVASPSGYTRSTFAIRGCDGPFSDVTTATSIAALTCAGGTTTAPDSIAISYEADRYNTVPTSANLPTDCVGSALTNVSITAPFVAGFSVADNRFYIANSTAGVPNLYCKGSSSSTQPLVENVEDLQLSYGVVSSTNTTSTASVAGYLTSDELTALGGGAAWWGRVMTVRVCVVVRSENPVVTDTASGSYYKCDGTLDSSKTDNRLRHAYSTTVVLRNRRS